MTRGLVQQPSPGTRFIYVVFCPLSWCLSSFRSSNKSEARELEREHWAEEHGPGPKVTYP